MSTRSIVTSQPDVACDVCERRLLRGEQPDIFLAAGQPRTVCELCAPARCPPGLEARAPTQHALGPAPLRAGRGRSLFGRLRQSRRTGAVTPSADADAGSYEQEVAARMTSSTVASSRTEARAAPRCTSRPCTPTMRRPRRSLRRSAAARNRCVQRRRVPAPRREPDALARRPRGHRTARRGRRQLDRDRARLGALLVHLRGRSRRPAGHEARARSPRAPSSPSWAPSDRLANAFADERGALALR